MGLSIAGKNITGSVSLVGRNVNKLNIAGKDVWTSSASNWTKVWSGSVSSEGASQEAVMEDFLLTTVSVSGNPTAVQVRAKCFFYPYGETNLDAYTSNDNTSDNLPWSMSSPYFDPITLRVVKSSGKLSFYGESWWASIWGGMGHWFELYEVWVRY